jgi:hypothetical protein
MALFYKKREESILGNRIQKKIRDGKLIEYEGCASEGLYTLDFQKYADYLNEDKLVKKLSIGRTTKEVKFFNETYPIIKQTKDSVFVKTKIKDEFYVFIGKIPFIK